MTRDADLLGNFLRFNDDGSAPEAARKLLTSASCEDLGNCAEVARAKAAARWQVARKPVFIGLVLAAFLIAAVVAARAMPRAAGGWVVPLAATLVIGACAIAPFAVLGLMAPNLGYEAILYLGFLIYGLLPHLAAVVAIAVSLANGRVTRYRIFALVVGLLIPALIATWLAVAKI